MRYVFFGASLGLLSFGVILNDAAEAVPLTMVTAAAHQTSILVMFFSAFMCGAAAIYDLVDRKSTKLAKDTFIYFSVLWCIITGSWAVGYYFMVPLMTGISPTINVLQGFDTPFSFGFFAPTVPRLVMVAYDAASLVAAYFIWTTKSVRFALIGIIVPVIFVNVWAFIFGTVTFNL